MYITNSYNSNEHLRQLVVFPPSCRLHPVCWVREAPFWEALVLVSFLPLGHFRRWGIRTGNYIEVNEEGGSKGFSDALKARLIYAPSI